MSTKIEFYRPNQIGGCVTVISTEKTKIVIDYGEELPGTENRTEINLDWDSVNAVFFTHYHGDHIGKIGDIPENIPIYMGEAAYELLQNIWRHVNVEMSKRMEKRLKSNMLRFVKAAKMSVIGDMRITSYSIDHSAYDAYIYLIETGNKTILHMGDFRGHGYQGKALVPMINKYIRRDGKRNVDILITEGTMLSRDNEEVITEEEMREEAKELLRNNRHAFLICSSANLDSLASFYHAARANGIRMFVYSDYVLSQLNTFSEYAGKLSDGYKFENCYLLNSKILLRNKAWKAPKTQKEFMREYGFLAIIKPEDYCQKYIDDFIDLKPMIIYSMWDGYLNPEHAAYNRKWHEFILKQERNGAEIKHLHTSGHASRKTLAEVITAVDPKEKIYPIHTENAEGLKSLDIPQKYIDMIEIIGSK